MTMTWRRVRLDLLIRCFVIIPCRFEMTTGYLKNLPYPRIINFRLYQLRRPKPSTPSKN